jgi:hypothetical protein
MSDTCDEGPSLEAQHVAAPSSVRLENTAAPARVSRSTGTGGAQAARCAKGHGRGAFKKPVGACWGTPAWTTR